MRFKETRTPSQGVLVRTAWPHASGQPKLGHKPLASGNAPHFTWLLCIPKVGAQNIVLTHANLAPLGNLALYQ